MGGATMPQVTDKALMSREVNLAVDDQICWIEVKQYPYQPDHQVELLHLQAEADALLLQLQAVNQRRIAAQNDR
jgi:hypothetical protein